MPDATVNNQVDQVDQVKDHTGPTTPPPKRRLQAADDHPRSSAARDGLGRAVCRVPRGRLRLPLGLAVWISFHDYFFTRPG